MTAAASFKKVRKIGDQKKKIKGFRKEILSLLPPSLESKVRPPGVLFYLSQVTEFFFFLLLLSITQERGGQSHTSRIEQVRARQTIKETFSKSTLGPKVIITRRRPQLKTK